MKLFSQIFDSSFPKDIAEENQGTFQRPFNTRTEFGTRRRCQKVYPFIKELVPLFHGRKIKIQRD